MRYGTNNGKVQHHKGGSCIIRQEADSYWAKETMRFETADS